MAPGQELPREILREGMAFDETGEEALAEQLHDRCHCPGFEVLLDETKQRVCYVVNGLRIVRRPSMTCPSCRSSEYSVVHPASSAAAATNAS